MPRVNRFATSAVFAISGLAFGAWAGRIPAVKADLGLSSSVLGLCLLGMAIGSLVGMQLVKPAVARWGTPPVVTAGIVAVCLGLLPLPYAPSAPALGALLAVWGATMGFIDVAMNSHAVAVEEDYGRPIMSSFHGWFSLGGFTGAGIAGLAAAAGASARSSITATGLVLAALALAAGLRLHGGPLPGSVPGVAAEAEGGRTRRGGFDRRVVLLGACAFIALMSEGAVGDWSAVMLREDRDASAAVATLGFVAFNACMTVGRFLGDRVTLAWGPGATLRRGAALGSAGLLVGLLLPGAVPSVIGFALLGIGLSVSVPLLFSAAGALPGTQPGHAIARVSTLGYLGFLLGPPAIGALGDLVSLPFALGATVVLLVPVALAAPLVVGRRTGRGPGEEAQGAAHRVPA